MTKKRLLARLAFGFVVVMCGAFAGTSGAQTGDYCTQTADTLLDACKASVMDDGAVGKAVCINITDTKARNTCLDDLANSQDEANTLCEGQHDTRLAACGVLGEGRYDPDFRPARFDDPRHPSNPNPYFPIGVGKHWEYRSATQVNTVDVVNETKLIAGVTCIVFRDLVFEDGAASMKPRMTGMRPAKDGSVWYFGEETEGVRGLQGRQPVATGARQTSTAHSRPVVTALSRASSPWRRRRWAMPTSRSSRWVTPRT